MRSKLILTNKKEYMSIKKVDLTLNYAHKHMPYLKIRRS